MEYNLKVENLSKIYKKTGDGIHNIDLEIPKGAIMGFVGENGAGKTTTISCILNILLKDSGKIEVFGKEMKDSDTDLREDIGIVFDATNFSGDLTSSKISNIMKNIYKNWDDALFFRYLNDFKIHVKKKVREYSRGMQMKLSIAVALSHHPKLLVLDEATSGLDPIMRDEILDIFLDFIQDENKSIFISSHITADLEKIADYITFIHAGKIILTAPKDDLRYNYAVIRCPSSQFEHIDTADLVSYRKQEYQTDILVNNKTLAEKKYKDFIIDSVSIDEIMILLVKGEQI